MKAVSGQKRPIKSATKTPVAAKKAKSDTPQKTGDLLLSFALFRLDKRKIFISDLHLCAKPGM